MLSRRLHVVTAWVARRPRTVLAAVTLLALGAAALAALTLRPTASTDTFVGRSSASWQATEAYHRRFGDDAVYVLVREPVTRLVLTDDLQRLLGLEGCLSGNVPKGAKVPGGSRGPCAALARTKPVRVVYGPGTFVNEAVRQIADQFSAQSAQAAKQADQAAKAAYELARGKGRSVADAKRLARQARKLVEARYTRDVLTLALRYGLTSVPGLDDRTFVSKLVFSDQAVPGTPKQRFAYLFPNRDAALVQVRLRPDLSAAERRSALALIRRAVAMPAWRLSQGRYVVSGAPVVLADLSGTIVHSLVVLLIAALLVMAATLSLVFRARLRLLPLAVALCASALTFGALALSGLPLTMASIGVLPVLIGLAVDYAIQFQSRAGETRDAVRAAALGGPTIVTAGAATAAGCLALALSPVPMVRQFGLLLVIGVVLALACALTAGTAALTLARRRAGGGGGRLASAARGADDLLARNPVAGALRAVGAGARRRALTLATGRSRAVLGAAVVLAVAGWALEARIPVQSDVNRLVPQDLPALRDLSTLQRATGVGGEIDVMVSASDLTDPKVVAWMSRYQDRMLKRYGYRDGRGCGEATLCPAFSLPDLFSGGSGTATRSEIRGLLDAVPPYFSKAVITPRRDAATLAFGIRLMPLSEQADVVAAMRRALDPPEGVTAQLVGLPVLAADASAQVSSGWRRALQLVAGLLAVALVLLIALRSWRRALVPLVPIALATGWSALVLFALRVELNPMSVTLGVLVVAISTEFSVLLAERYRQERAGGLGEREALERTYRSTGAAVLASGATAIAGFAVLGISDVVMLRDFGWVTVVDLAVSLVGVLAVLPAVLVAAERRAARASRRRALPRPWRLGARRA